jgi:hypothetical protein
MNIIMQALEKLIILNSLTSTIGCFCRHSHTTMPTRQTMEVITRAVMKREPNQSSSCPLSRKIWSAETPNTSSENPTVSKCISPTLNRRRKGGSATYRKTSPVTRTPTGRLMKKIQRQE